MLTRFNLAVGICCALICQSASAQTPPAQIKKTTTAPVIDGVGNDAAWANATVYGTTTWFQAEPQIPDVPLEETDDIKLEWRALWDNTNLYVLAKINDDSIVNSRPEFGGPDTNADFNDDGIEFYIDAQDVNNLEYSCPTCLNEPTYQFTAIAGWTPTIANDATYLKLDEVTPVSPRSLRTPASLPNTSFTYGINSYDGNDDQTRYPQEMGSATSGPITENPAGGFDWEFEASFPWEALEETPADILAAGRDGIFGFGVAYNDDDDLGGRDTQYMWGTHRNDLWHVSEAFPDAQLVDSAGNPSDVDTDGDVDGADFLSLQRSGGNIAAWKAAFGPGVSAVPEPAGVALAGLASLALLRFFARRRT